MLDEKVSQYQLILDGRDYHLWKTNDGKIIYDCGDKRPININIPPDMELEDLKIIIEYARSLSRMLFEFTLSNQSTIKTAWKLYSLTQSRATLHNYIYGIYYFCKRLNLTPDQLVAVYRLNNEIAEETTRKIVRIVERDRARNLMPSSCKVRLAYLESFFRFNGLDVKISDKINWPRIRKWYASESPKPEEVAKMIDLAPTLRDKAIITILPTSGLRIGTLLQLKYKHIMEDFEANRIPCMIRIDADITKGKYAPYITFMNEEAVYYLNLYLEQRRKGTNKIPPENITPESWLFVSYENRSKPLTYITFLKVFENICRLMNVEKRGSRYKYSIHSFRKFFKTQLISKGVEEAIVDYWMGHVRDTYTRIRDLDVDFLRNKYLSANLRIRETKTDERQLKELLKNIVRQYGYDPERFIVPGATIISEDAVSRALARFIFEDEGKLDKNSSGDSFMVLKHILTGLF
jgi:site-specific recombinase XerD